MFCSKNGVKSAHGTLTDIVVLSLYPGKRPSRAASSARLNAKKKKKTIGKNVGHKDADNKVWGDREAALCKMLGKSVGKLTKWHSMSIAAPA